MFFDQSDLPRPIPLLDPFFPLDCSMNVSKHFVVHEQMNRIPFRETIDKVVFVSIDSICEITRYANVQRSISSTSKDIHEVD